MTLKDNLKNEYLKVLIYYAVLHKVANIIMSYYVQAAALKRCNNYNTKYNSYGNPLSYRGKTLKWRGRRLVKINNTEMQYDYNGLRVRKGNRTYYWQGNNIKIEKIGNGDKNIYYYYDESGVCGMRYNNEYYYFRKNMLGDILAIYHNGSMVCKYVYDAWGNHKIFDKDGNLIADDGTTIGSLNPFRYRGYYWDREFDLYYLQSRYYDPQVGRFISPDDVSYLNPESICGMNLYAYCGNNPVMYVDPSGCSALAGFFTAFVIGAVATFVINVVSQSLDKGLDRIDWREAGAEAILGGVLGGLGVIGGYLALGLVPSAQVAGLIVLGLSSAISAGIAAYTLNNYGKEDFNMSNALISVGATLAQGISAMGAGYLSAYLGLFNSLRGDKTATLLFVGLRALIKMMLSDPWKRLSEIFDLE